MRGIDRWIEGDFRGAPSEWRTKRQGPPVADSQPVGAISKDLASMTPAELIGRLRAILKGMTR